MTLAPLLQAPVIIQVHAFAAMGAFVLGVVQLAGVKGTTMHRSLGYAWALLMLVVVGSSFFIHQIKQFAGFSLIHLLSIFTLVMLPTGLLYARRHNVARHRTTMLALFSGALVIAGLFTFLPNRIMGRVVFGG